MYERNNYSMWSGNVAEYSVHVQEGAVASQCTLLVWFGFTRERMFIGFCSIIGYRFLKQIIVRQ